MLMQLMKTCSRHLNLKKLPLGGEGERMREGRDSRRREMGNNLEDSINLYNGSIFWDHVFPL